MPIITWFPSLPFFCAAVISIGIQRRVSLRGFIRPLGIVATIISLFLAGIGPTLLTIEDGVRASHLLTISHLAVSAVVVAVVPYRVMSRRDFPLVFIIQGLSLGLFRVSSVLAFILLLLVINGLVAGLVINESIGSSVDSRNRERNDTYLVFRLLSITFLCLFSLSRGMSYTLHGSLAHPPAGVMNMLSGAFLSLSLFSLLGLFPFHSWFPLFLGSPRLNLFIPLTTISMGVAFFERFFVRLFPSMPSDIGLLTTILGAIGLIYGALLLFGEHRLKRIVGYVVMSHLGLMVLVGTSGSEVAASLPVQVDSVNLLFAAGGLVVVLAILSSRFGLAGVTSASGLASAYPELGICFLVCALSLVGFPGTLGFVSEELLFHGRFAYRAQLLPIIVTALALNGYSCFRLFARSFFGTPSFPDATALPLATRERISLLVIPAFIVLDGLFPDLMFRLVSP